MNEFIDFEVICANYIYIKNSAIRAYVNGFKILKQTDNQVKFVKVFESGYQEILPGIILMATAIEGYINAYGKYLISSSEFKRYDKLSSLDKLGLFYRLRTGKEIDRGTKLIEDLKSLFTLRNKIVHEKPKISRVRSDSIQNIDMFGIRGEVIQVAISSIDLFDRISDFIGGIEDSDECPILKMTISNPMDFEVKLDEKLDEYFNPITNKLEEYLRILTDKINDYEGLPK